MGERAVDTAESVDLPLEAGVHLHRLEGAWVAEEDEVVIGRSHQPVQLGLHRAARRDLDPQRPGPARAGGA